MKSLCDSHAASPPTVVRSHSAARLDRPSWSTLQPEESNHHTNNSNNPSYSIKIPSTWTVGKVSLIFLVLAAIGDLALQQSFQGLEHLQAYDALSTDVIRPAFSYSSTSRPQPRSSLGSAAISSVTEALSPILPFTGGVDLRREDYWASSPWETMQSLSSQIRDAFASAEDETLSPTASPKSKALPKRVKAKRTMVLSAAEPFVKTKVIGELTLADVTETFRYAIESSKEDFDETKFLRKLSPDMKHVMAALQTAVAQSRGTDASDASISLESPAAGSVDALKFSAAMRIFAEWRLLRQTPEGYKGFAVGMSLGHKDVVQNVVKIEQAVHAWLDHQSDVLDLQIQWENEPCPSDKLILTTPTIGQILGHEAEMNVHPNLPRLKDKTAAMGLLWVRRQLQYQTHLFGNTLLVPERFTTTRDAVVTAYTDVYDRYHGWAVQKIFNYSFQAAPEASVVFRHMNPRKLKEVQANLRNGKAPRANASHTETFSGDGETDEENPVAVFFTNIGNLWNDLTNNKEQQAVASTHDTDTDYLEQLVSADMVRDASQHIAAYMQVVEPLLQDLEAVFDLNTMDDPSKV
jgi:hypothetical protein